MGHPRASDLERRLHELELLLDVLKEASATLSLDEVLRAITARVGSELGLDEFAVLLIDDATGRFRLRAAYGSTELPDVLRTSVAPGDGAAGRAIASGEAVVEGGVLHNPVRFRGEVIGVLRYRRDARPFDVTERRFLAAIGEVAALAIGNARLFAAVEALSRTDALTRLGNRRFLDERLALEWDRAVRFGHPVALLIADLDRFKTFNDHHGHPAGDAALQAVAEVLRGSVRRIDAVARYGGEEFAIVLPRVTAADALALAEKLRARVEQMVFPGADGARLTLSVGATSLLPQGGTHERLIAAADEALYAAKRAGRNRSMLVTEP